MNENKKQKYTILPVETYNIVMDLRRKTGWGPKKIKEHLDKKEIPSSNGAIRGWIYHNKKPYVTTSINKISSNSKELTHEKAYIIGTLCGDGYLSTGYRIGLSVCDKDFADYFKSCLEKVYGVKCSISIRKRKSTSFTDNPNEQYIVSLCSKLVVEDLQRYLISFKSKDWSVPKQIKESSKEIQAAFIKGFADSEGSVRYRKCHSEISLCSGNLTGIKQIQKMFFGTFRITSKIGKMNWEVQTLVIWRYDSLKKFNDEIGFVIKRKQDNLRNGLDSYKRKGLRRYDEEFKHLAMYLLKQGFKHGKIARLLKTSRTNIYDWEKRLKSNTLHFHENFK